MSEPGWLDVSVPAGRLRALMWGPVDGPAVLCLHGVPDTAYGWRKVAPALVDAGWRVVAPFLRGYVPSSPPSDGSYHIGALMDDALRVRQAAGPTGRDVVVGHDWGAVAAAGLAAPVHPTRYLHGADDGCATSDDAQWVRRILPEGSDVAIAPREGHFLQLEQPDEVARPILDFVGTAH